MNLIIIPLDNKLNKESFDCGINPLNDYLKKYANQDQKRGISLTFVAINSELDKQLLGYYSISMAQVEIDSLPEENRKKLPRYPIPAMRLARLAVDQSQQGKGLGETLLFHALSKATKFYQEIGIAGVIVDASNEKARNFYLKYDFIPLIVSSINYPLPLFLTIKTILKLNLS